MSQPGPKFPLVSGPEILEADERVMTKGGLSSVVLMESAGSAVARVILDRVSPKGKCAILCG